MQTAAIAQPPVYHPAWQSMSTILWIAALAFLLIYFRREIDAVSGLIVRRLRQGSGIRVGSFELGKAYVSPGELSAVGGAIQKVRKDDGRRHAQREQYYQPNRLIMLVHRVSPSASRGQLYDILLYLMPHPNSDATLLGVKQVEYYFGKSWNRSIFTSVDRARGFPISTSAYGPFMCTAEIEFVDGNKVMVSRYVDFEMGAAGPEPLASERSEPKQS